MSRISSANSVRNIPSSVTRYTSPGRRYSCRSNSSRPILVPFHNVNICSTVLSKNDFNRVKTASKQYTKEDRERELQKFEDEQRRLQEESNRRKEFLQYIDEVRNRNQNDSIDLMKDPKEDERILSRVFWTKHEQEDEVKRANHIILAKKVHMVQDAQINEKRELEREWHNEQLRLEKEMLEKDQKALIQLKKEEELRKRLRDDYAKDLRRALDYHESKRLLEAQKIENEAEVIAKANQALKADEESKEQARRERAAKIQQDFQEAKKITAHYRMMAHESKRMAEMKAQQYMQFKAEQQRIIEKEKRLERERKQREIDRILVRQTQFLQTKQRNEEALLRRIQEEKERQFRQKIMEAAQKNRELMRDVAEGRSKQIGESRRMLDKLKELESKEKREIEKEKLVKIKNNYRKEILDQIALKEQQKHKKKAMAYIESDEQRREEEKRQQNIRRVLEAKVQAMRDSKIPEKLVRDVERQLNLK